MKSEEPKSGLRVGRTAPKLTNGGGGFTYNVRVKGIYQQG